jgi:hypothetical protein
MRSRLYMTKVILMIISLTVFTGIAYDVRADDLVIDIRDFTEGDLVVDGFKLKEKTKLYIAAVGAESESGDGMYAYGWILDAATREPAWILDEEDTKRYLKSDYLREFDGEVTLPKGTYEAYYFAGQPLYFDGVNISIDNLEDAVNLLEHLFGGDKEKYYKRYSEDTRDLMFTIRAPENSFEKFNPVDELGDKALVNFTRVGDDFYESKGFTLKKDMALKVIALGEYVPGDRVFVDFGWIIDAASRRKVWQMDKWNTTWAGGGRKNRGFVGDVDLPAGNYVAFYASDNSHSFGDWNVQPPYDPLHYGLAVYATDENELKNVAEYVDDYPAEHAIIDLTRIRDNKYESKGFTLKKKADLHIVALGEFGYDDYFVDYGWIENLDNNEIVWEMTEENTEHAGGAAKNRKFDGLVTFPAGSYMVYYVSDGSHSYRNWNASPPIDQKMWGISVFWAGKNFDSSIVTVFEDTPENKNLLVDLTGIGDDEDVREAFRLESPGKIHIFALGEGRDGEMYDYGWIENAENGDVIWEMTYRKTKHAGGDRKNRMVDTNIYLEAGRYYAYYVTDGSHSFPDFNASPPRYPQKWGIQISKM